MQVGEDWYSVAQDRGSVGVHGVKTWQSIKQHNREWTAERREECVVQRVWEEVSERE